MEQVKASGKKRILVVEDEAAIRDLVSKFLTREGFEACPVANGLLAQQALSLEKYDAVVSDINMPGSRVSGLDLLQHIKTHCPMPVLLMTGFASMANTREAHDLGADAFLAKPFKQADLLSSLKTTLKLTDAPAGSVAAPDEDDKYCRLNIGGFLCGKTIKHAIFIRLGPQKYIKIAHQGEDLPVRQIEHYKSKGIQYLYLLREDFLNYVRASLSISKAACNSKAIDRSKKVSVMKHTGEVILESLAHHPIDREKYEEAKSMVEITVDFLTDDQEALGLLSSLNHYSDYLYAHSVGVSFYTTLIAKELKWNSTPTLIKVALAGLLHDVGYKEIDKSILEKPRGLMTPEEVKTMETHTVRGAKLLSGIARVPGEVIQAILQHHERDCGLGFPCGLTRHKIHPLAKIVAVADEFCELAIQRPGHPAISPGEALHLMKTLHGAVLDQEALAALTRVLPRTIASPKPARPAEQVAKSSGGVA